MAPSSSAAASPLTCHQLGLRLLRSSPTSPLSLRRRSTAASLSSKQISHSHPKPLPLAPTATARRLLPPVSVAATSSPAPASPPLKPVLQGAAIKPLLASIATVVLIWLIPPPAGMARNAWRLLAVFLTTIVGIISQPLGAVALLGLGAAFFFARGFIKTGLGSRVAYAFVSAFGGSSLGLGYALVFSEALLAPAIPSVFARAGGIFLPLMKSLCEACRSRTGDGTERKLGSWLMLTCFQTPAIPSVSARAGGIFLPLVKSLCEACGSRTGDGTERNLGSWLVKACEPARAFLQAEPNHPPSLCSK